MNGLPEVTLGYLRELAKKLPDSTTINFMYRAGWPGDDGDDFIYTPQYVWFESNKGSNDKISGLTLVSVLPPEANV